MFFFKRLFKLRCLLYLANIIILIFFFSDIQIEKAIKINKENIAFLNYKSEGDFTIENEVIDYNCFLFKGLNKDSFCKLQLFINDDRKGVDLTDYDEIELFLTSKSATQLDLNLINDKDENRVNTVSLFLKEEDKERHVAIVDFNVSTDWIKENQIPVEEQFKKMDNVIKIEFAIHQRYNIENHSILISEINLKKPLVNKYYCVAAIIFTLFFICCSLLLEIVNNKKRLEQSHVRIDRMNKMLKDYKEKSYKDPLTGCLNRAALDRFVLEYQRALQENPEDWYYVVMFDIDHFKSINDLYGHKIGDEALMNLTKEVKMVIRDSDQLYRMGGEEFLLVFKNINKEKLDERIDVLMEAIKRASPIEKINMTASFGIAKQVDEKQFEKTMNEADKALYYSKNNGRNQHSYYSK